jgi:hypothetical protein
MIDEPRKDYYAAEVAAPLFKKIATRTAALLNLSPKKGLDTAGPAVASAWGTASKTEPPGPKVSQRKDKSPEIPQTEFNETPTAGPTMPDLRGMTLYEALQTLELRLDRIQVVGSGFITEQVPDAGTPLSQKTKIQLSLSPESDV